MNEDFIKIKSLDGELKISHKKNDFGLTVSTEELVLQKPHINYHIKLKDIVSIVPFNTAGFKRLALSSRSGTGREVANLSVGTQHYRFYVSEATVHNRSGIHSLGPTEFILPILGDLLQAVSRYGNLPCVQTG